MIQHIVMFKLKEEAEGKGKAELLETAKSILKDFKAEIPQLKEFSFETNLPGTPDVNYDIALFCGFDSIEDMEAYKIHPKHLEYRNFITNVRESRACIDYEK